jgi:hypothetical protein
VFAVLAITLHVHLPEIVREAYGSTAARSAAYTTNMATPPTNIAHSSIVTIVVEMREPLHKKVRA